MPSLSLISKTAMIFQFMLVVVIISSKVSQSFCQTVCIDVKNNKVV